MGKEKKLARTYIQGNLSKKQSSHMDYLGFSPTQTPGEFEAEKAAAREWGLRPHITAKHDTLTAGSQLPMHSHSFMEIFRYTSDSQVEYLIGSHRYIVQKGDVICVPPGTCHQVLRYEPADTPCVRDLIVVAPNILDAIGWSSPPEQYYLLRANDAKQRSFDVLCSRCIHEFENQEFRWGDMLLSYVQILLIQILRSSDLAIKAEPDGLFEQVLTYINSNLSQRITLAETARHFFVSERTVTREFQKNLGVSFYRYVTQRRLLTARNLMFNGVPLKTVCQQTGFSDYPTFFRAFKKEYGMSPREMKELDLFLTLG